MYDLTGQKFGRLTVLSLAEKNNRRRRWNCVCECGNKKEVGGNNLRNGHTKSCGCLQKEKKSRIGLYRYKDLTNQRFGRLLVIKFSHTDKNNSYWICKCDCGSDYTTRGSSLKNGSCRSCGCLHKEVTSDLRKLPIGEAAFNSVYSNYKNNARKRNLIFDISKDVFKNIINENCHYCGKEPANVQKTGCDTGIYIYNGIDRLNGKFGYIKDNIVPCCDSCNKMKMNMNREQFFEHIKNIYLHRIEKRDI